MSHESRLHALRQKFASLSQEVDALKELRKNAFLAAPPMPQGGQPPMDPAMMQGGGAPPMDPAMMGGAPPMDPAMMQGGAPMAPPMDPNAQQAPPPIDPAMLDQIVGLLEEMGQKIQQQGEALEELKNAVTGEIQDIGDGLAALEQRIVEGEAASAAAQPAAPAAW